VTFMIIIQNTIKIQTTKDYEHSGI
jgi:hypothetical protein